jgi:hypothetical protein
MFDLFTILSSLSSPFFLSSFPRLRRFPPSQSLGSYLRSLPKGSGVTLLQLRRAARWVANATSKSPITTNTTVLERSKLAEAAVAAAGWGAK